MAFDLTPAELEHEIRNTDGVEVALGGSTTWGHLDREPADALDSPSIPGRMLLLVVATGRLPGLRQDQYLMVGTTEEGSARTGTRYRVRYIEDQGGGPETMAYLAEAD